ncbi:MAG: hypothetical protein HC802_14105 [Caldilineaceae bacterium]|nr:hypothetical protein [Caldilineaceae bacterium]
MTKLRQIQFCIVLLALGAFVAGCAPTAEGNVLGYLVAKQLGTLGTPNIGAPPGALQGQVLHEGQPVTNAVVVVAERDGTPHTARTDSSGRYQIDGIPPGQYVPAAVGADYDEATATDALGNSRLVTIRSGETGEAPLIVLQKHVATELPQTLASAVNLTMTHAYTATSVYPPGSQAQVYAYQFERDGVVVDSVRVYLPLDLEDDQQLPLLFVVYPGGIEGWEPVSVAFADQGFALVALSPTTARGVDIDEHTLDSRVVLALAQSGALTPHVGDGPAVALGGSFSSAILHCLLRDEADEIAAWVTVGGISDAFNGTADFYAGELEIPESYATLIPALGLPNIYPLNLLRYSPIFTAEQLPPTLIVHTGADTIIPIDQAIALEDAVRGAGVPVETFYYEDTSHYLQVDENMSDAGKEMFDRIVNFARSHLQ